MYINSKYCMEWKTMFFKNKKRYVVHTVGDPVLREKAKPVPAVTPEIRQLAIY